MQVIILAPWRKLAEQEVWVSKSMKPHKAISKRTSKMKTYKHLIDIATSDEIMDGALMDGTEGKSDREEVQEVIEKKEKLKPLLREKFNNKELKPILHKAHEINDGFKQKKRIIIQPYFTPNKPEQWIQHIVVKTLKPIFMKGMYKFSCGSVPNRGVHYGKKYLEKFIKKNPKKTKYVLKLDIHHFYESVDIQILKERFAQIIKDDKMLALIYFVLDSNAGILPDGTIIKRGLPIGFYTSQWFANWFLQPFDHFVKEELKADFYMRYMDDIVIFGSNKRELHRIFKRIEEYLGSINLKVKSNWQVFRFDYIDKNGKRQGRFVDFMGFKFYRDKTTIRKSIFLRACRTARRISKKLKISWRDACQILSYMGWFYPTDTFKAYLKHIKPFVSVRMCKKIMSNHDRRKNDNSIQDGSKQSKTNGN